MEPLHSAESEATAVTAVTSFTSDGGAVKRSPKKNKGPRRLRAHVKARPGLAQLLPGTALRGPSMDKAEPPSCSRSSCLGAAGAS